VAALSAFLTYVGAGLDGQAGLGDFNLQMNDNYQGQVVKGCPTYEQVRQPSMDGFDLDIKLTSDSKVSTRNCVTSICLDLSRFYYLFTPGILPIPFDTGLD